MIDHECLFIAVAKLNNIAVHLIQQNSFLEAISTLKDAIQLTKDYFCCVDASRWGSDGSRNFSTAAQQRADIDRLIHAAQKRKESIQERGSVQNEPNVRDHPINILVVSDNDSATTVDRALQRNNNALYCITVDTDYSYMLNDGLQLQSTIVFYNYGIAFRCIAEAHQGSIDNMDTTTTPTTTVINIMKTRHDATLASFIIFEISYTLISRSMHVFDYVDEGLNLLTPSCNLIYMLVLYNLCQLSRAAPFLGSRVIYYKNELKRVLRELHNMEILHFIESFMASSIMAPAA